MTNTMYEKIEDGQIEFAEPEYRDIDKGEMTLRDLGRTVKHAQKWAKWAKNEENKNGWAKLHKELSALYARSWKENNDPDSKIDLAEKH
jgi:hypothetical protein